MALSEINQLESPPTSNSVSETGMKYSRALGRIHRAYAKLNLIHSLSATTLNLDFYPLLKDIGDAWSGGLQLYDPDKEVGLTQEQISIKFIETKTILSRIVKFGEDTGYDKGKVDLIQLRERLNNYQ